MGFTQGGTSFKTVEELAKLILTVVGTDVKAIKGGMGALNTLSTTNKTSLVLAINELKTLVDGANPASLIADNVSTSASKTYSIDKIKAEIASAVTVLLGGADGANDTLKEIADRVTAAAQGNAGLVSAKTAQTFTAAEQEQARNNINSLSKDALGNTNFDVQAYWNSAIA